MKKLFAVLVSFHLMVGPVLAQGTHLPGTNETNAQQDAYLSDDNGLGIGGSGSKGGHDFYLNQILVIGTSTIGATIVTQCVKALMMPSIAAFMVGSGVHIMAEITGAKAKNQRHQQKLKDLKILEADLKKKGDVSQVEIMKHQLIEEEETKDFLRNRKKWMTAVTVVYSAAAGLAIAEEIGAISAGILGGPPAYKAISSGGCTMSKTGSAAAKGLGMLLASGYGLAGSNGGAISQYGTMLVGALGTFIPSLGNAIVPAYEMAFARIITFGASAVLTGAVTRGSARRENLADRNISKLKSAIAQFKSDTDSLNTGLVAGVKPSDSNSKSGAPKPLTVDQRKECFSNQNNEWVNSSAACANPMKLPKINLGKFSLPAISNVSRLATDLGQALATGNEAKAAELAGEIGSFAARVKSENDALKAEYNKLQQTQKKEPIDFDKSINTQVASLSSSLKDAASSAKVDLASLGKTEKLADESMSPVVPAVTTASAPVIEAADPLSGVSNATEELAPDMSDLAAKESAPSLDDFESSAQDISKEPEVSLFKQVSNRYILNYGKMFERKKAPEAEGSTPE